jgi:dsRNA-specific ribonuclease
MAWHRATAAVLIQQLGGEVPKEWIAKDVAAQVVREVGIEPNRVPYLLSVLRERKLPNPKFSFGHEGPMHKPTFYCTCTVGDTMAEGIGENKQQAKNVAAHVMLKKLNGIAKGRTETAT